MSDKPGEKSVSETSDLTTEQFDAIKSRTANARLEWMLQSDEPCELLDDLATLAAELIALRTALADAQSERDMALVSLGREDTRHRDAEARSLAAEALANSRGLAIHRVEAKLADLHTQLHAVQSKLYATEQELVAAVSFAATAVEAGISASAQVERLTQERDVARAEAQAELQIITADRDSWRQQSRDHNCRIGKTLDTAAETVERAQAAEARAEALQAELVSVAGHVRALFPMDSGMPIAEHAASFIIHVTNHMNDSRLAQKARADALQQAIRAHRDQRGDDRCWLDDATLYGALPEGYTPRTHDTVVELERCRRFIASRQNPATTYVSPQRRIEELEARADAAERALRDLLAVIVADDLIPESVSYMRQARATLHAAALARIEREM